MSNDRDGSGALFRETDKKSDKSPDYTGSLTLGGVKYRLAGWVREGQRGKFLSISAKPDEQRPTPEQRAASQKPAGGPTFGDDQIPFAAEGR